MLAALRHLLHARDRGPVEIVVVLPGLDEFVVLRWFVGWVLDFGSISGFKLMKGQGHVMDYGAI